ncbi:scavenger receptor cysteine-rich type 1 protein M130-like [Sebastes umbrosus]|uniref:scavenger receptor cysteine-rich type 1 protein M130-like n=1 Tax=Sebastes umbrosus TaxID=72105 RepID=UPI00189D29F5|nr:scavenger receptor cysteine-rich type 1 protein M130-like [Sebastes umbrosus]
MDQLLVLLLLLWSSGLQAEENHTSTESVRLVGGDGRCAGTLEVKHQGDWRPVSGYYWTLKDAAVACRELDCGSAVSVKQKEESSYRSVWWIMSNCVHSRSALRKCATSDTSSAILDLTCSDSVRLVNGTSLCSGRLEVKSNQSNQSNQGWSSVCEADFDQQDAEVVCRELGCGAPSVLQGALYGEVEDPMWTKEFQCGGNESALLDCRSSDSDRNICSPGKAVGLTCSESVRLVGGDSRCAGTLEVKHQGDWRPVSGYYSTLKEAAVACRELDCGSAVSVGERIESSYRSVWGIMSDCVQSGSSLRDCATSASSDCTLDLTCSDSVRLVNGTNLCSGRLEVKSNQLVGGDSRCAGTLEVKYQGDWRPVRDGISAWTLKEAAVACRHLDCGPAVSVGRRNESSLRSVWWIRSDCVQSGSSLRDCATSDSSLYILDLTCSVPPMRDAS